jgi:hypothetical protein
MKVFIPIPKNKEKDYHLHICTGCDESDPCFIVSNTAPTCCIEEDEAMIPNWRRMFQIGNIVE